MPTPSSLSHPRLAIGGCGHTRAPRLGARACKQGEASRRRRAAIPRTSACRRLLQISAQSAIHCRVSHSPRQRVARDGSSQDACRFCGLKVVRQGTWMPERPVGRRSHVTPLANQRSRWTTDLIIIHWGGRRTWPRGTAVQQESASQRRQPATVLRGRSLWGPARRAQEVDHGGLARPPRRVREQQSRLCRAAGPRRGTRPRTRRDTKAGPVAT